MQQIQEIRAQVHGLSSRVDDYENRLQNLLETLRLIEAEKELQTPSIQAQIKEVIKAGDQLKDWLKKLAELQANSKARQYTHALVHGDKDDKALSEILDRLNMAKAELSTRIITAHVGLTRSMNEGFTAALSIVRRVDRNVQDVLGQHLAIATQLETHKSLPSDNGKSSKNSAPIQAYFLDDIEVPLNTGDVQALNLTDQVEWTANKSYDNAMVFATDLVDRQPTASTTRTFKENEAHGNSTMLLGRSDAQSVVAMIQALRANNPAKTN